MGATDSELEALYRARYGAFLGLASAITGSQARGADAVTISCIGTRGNGCAGAERPLWQAQLRRDGLFVTIRSVNRALVVGAARSLVPIR